MFESEFDRKLNIKTQGLREWDFPTMHYNRYEATPYASLDQLFQHYEIDQGDSLVDFGCGRGRVGFYIHNRFHIPVTGVEVNEETFSEAEVNKKNYLTYNEALKEPINFKFGLAQHYKIQAEDNIFYFFNPFSQLIFEKVMRNIKDSLKKNKRRVDVILYYPLEEFIDSMKKYPEFLLIKCIKVDEPYDDLDEFLIYRWTC